MVRANFPATQCHEYPAFVLPTISIYQSFFGNNLFIYDSKIKIPIKRTSSQTIFLLFTLGLKFIIFNSVDFKSPSAVNSMLGLFISPSSETLRRCRKKLPNMYNNYQLIFCCNKNIFKRTFHHYPILLYPLLRTTNAAC